MRFSILAFSLISEKHRYEMKVGFSFPLSVLPLSFPNALILPHRLLKESELHLLYGSAVIRLMMKILNSSHLSHHLYWMLRIASCIHIYRCQDPSICIGFHQTKLQVSCLDLIYAAEDCMFLDSRSIHFRRFLIYLH